MHKRGGTKTILFFRSIEQSYDQWIYSFTTKGCIVVLPKNVATRLCKSGIGIFPSTLGNPPLFISKESCTFATIKQYNNL